MKDKETKLKEFWDHQYQGMDIYVAKKEDFTIENTFDEELKFLGDHCEKVLDFGCGVGYSLEEIFALGNKAKEGLGIDPSQNVIDYNNKINEHFRDQIEFQVGDEKNLREMKEESVDGIFCSNVLDVIPTEERDRILQEFYRILKKGGYFLMKINFYLTQQYLSHPENEVRENQEVYVDGVLRVVNHTTEEWLEVVKPFDLIRMGEFERIPNGPKDRLFLFRK